MSGLVVIGASYAGVQAALSAREAGYGERITLFSDEPWLPYQRPPLSKGYLLDAVNEDGLVLRDDAFFAAKQIDLMRGATVTRIDPGNRCLALADGTSQIYDKLMIATGSRPRQLALPGADLDGVVTLRTLRDAQTLKQRLAAAAEIVVIGGGFIGLEVAASAAKLGKRVTLFEAASRLLERAVSAVVSDALLDLHCSHGVDVRLAQSIAAIVPRNGTSHVGSVKLADGSAIGADLVLIGIGGIANSELAREAGLECTHGIVVDEHGRTSAPDVFAAGDCAVHENRFAGGWIRLESVQNAQDQARAAGLGIAGKHGPYGSVPRFWSDQYDCKLQTVGLSAGSDAHAVRGAVSDGRFSVFYYRGDRLIAVDSLNRPGDQMAARRFLAEGLSPSPAEAADLSFDLKSPGLTGHGADAT